MALCRMSCVHGISCPAANAKNACSTCKTPEGSLEVDRNIDTGEVDVEVTDKD